MQTSDMHCYQTRHNIETCGEPYYSNNKKKREVLWGVGGDYFYLTISSLGHLENNPIL